MLNRARVLRLCRTVYPWGYTVTSKEANTIKFLIEVTAAIVLVAFVIAVVVFWPYKESK